MLANVAADLWDWVAGVFARMGDISIYWLVLALALKTAESAFIGLGWRNILHAAYPNSGLSFKTTWGASQGGTGINAVTPAQAGTATMIGIFRASIPGSSVAGLASATVVQALFFTVVKPRLLSTWHKVKEGAAIFRDRRRYAKEVGLPSAASFCCRIGVNIVFMAAFGIPITAFTVFLVGSSHTLSQVFAITPGGVGQTQALDVATLRPYASSHDIAAFSITQDSVITIWNVVLGVAVMIWAFGFRQMKEMVRKKGKSPAGQPSTP